MSYTDRNTGSKFDDYKRELSINFGMKSIEKTLYRSNVTVGSNL